MPRDRDFKRLVRRRMRKTGEAYTSARAQLSRRAAPAQHFDRFSTRARRALAAAHQEAAASGRDIGAEHLVLGLLRVEDGMAAKVLARLGADRGALELRLRADGVPAGGAPDLTGDARRAIELAVAEAAALGHGFVGTEHLLLGVLAEGSSAACRALRDARIDLARVRDGIRREEPRAVGVAPRAGAWRPMPAGDVAALLERARAERLSGAMRLRRRGAGPAVLYFLFGHLFHAVHEGAAGDEAVLSALGWPAGEVLAEFDGRSRLPADGTVRATVPQLIERARTNLER